MCAVVWLVLCVGLFVCLFVCLFTFTAEKITRVSFLFQIVSYTIERSVKLQWLEHLWDH